jgi:HD-like signal output (HDOD) protein
MPSKKQRAKSRREERLTTLRDNMYDAADKLPSTASLVQRMQQVASQPVNASIRKHFAAAKKYGEPPLQ